MKMEKKSNYMPTIYIAGKITNNPDYKEMFNGAEHILSTHGFKVLNPAVFPLGLTYKQYIKLGLSMLMEADYICMLPGSEDSPGAQFEKHYAELVGMPIIEF